MQPELQMGGRDEHTTGRSLVADELRSAPPQTRPPATQRRGSIGEMEQNLHRANSPCLEEGSRPAPPPSGEMRCSCVRDLGLTGEGIGTKLACREGLICKLCVQSILPESGPSIYHPRVQIDPHYYHLLVPACAT